MLKPVESKVDFIALEHEILEFWEKNEIFQKRVDANHGNPKWSFLDGPITANNPMGVHHAWGRTYKDVFQRYKAMKGFDQRYQNGFDCQGLWVEVEVEKQLGFKSKTDIEEYGIEKFVEACKERVRKYSKIQTDQSIRLGYWMDWDNSYFTMSDENNYTIWHFLKTCHDRGWIYKGNDVLPWCIDCGAALSEHEIATEGYVERTHTAIYIRFPLMNAENESLLVWTTTPWTLTSNVSAAIKSDMDYVKVKQGDEFLYLAENRVEILKEKGSYEIVEKLKGKKLLNRSYEGPFDSFEVQQGVEHKVIEWVDVNDEEGTGIVHIAPGCGHEDFILAKDLELAVIAPLDEFGTYLEGFGWLSGKNIRDVNQEIFDDLKSRGKLFKREQYTHRYPICWRHKSDLAFRLVDEWFISMDEFRHDIMEITQQIQWIPKWGEDQELDWLRNMDDWMISKKRYWGLALPIFECEECGNVAVIGSRDELKERVVEGWDEFKGNSPHRPWVDAVKIKCDKCGAVVSRIPDVGNPWLDAGIVPFSTMGYLDRPDYWKEWFPADFITESFPGQFRNWFYSLLAMSAALEKKPPFKTVLGHALVKDEKGDDMHKSAGNAIWFEDAAEEIGVDVLRWMFTAQNPEHNLLFGYGAAREIRKQLITLWNVYSFFVTYARLDEFDPSTEPAEKDFTKLDRWVSARLGQLILRAETAYESYHLNRLMKQVVRFLDDLSNWYVRRNRRRFWKSENDSDKAAAYQTLYIALKGVLKVLAPVIPFVSEAMYQNLVRGLESDAPESIHLCSFPEVVPSVIDEEVIRDIDAVIKLVEMGRHARNKVNLKIRQPLSKLQYAVSDDALAKAFDQNAGEIMDELNVKKIERVSSPEEIMKFSLKPNFKSLGDKYGNELNQIRDLLAETDYAEAAESLRGEGVISLSNNGSVYELSAEDVIVQEDALDGKSAVSEKQLTVAVITELTEELIQEGIVRDMIRSVQNMRKEAGFNVEDRITVFCDAEDDLKKALQSYENYFCNEVLAVNLSYNSAESEFSKKVEIRGQKVNYGISRFQKNRGN
ncbi:MAG TPA: isoleucine--tRNA ligase [Candidatus Marinimicrobia bacterium]|nr:isoleucine--tRNA ligase [Candidatus Neomarinimicrobiota bacterium]